MNEKKQSLLALGLLSVPLILFLLWLLAVQNGNDHTERVEIFHSYLPNFLEGRAANNISLLFALATFILSGRAMLNFKGIWKIMNILSFVLSLFLMLLNLFSLM